MTQKQDTPIILAIESSCDDTAAAIIRNCKILANIVSSQPIHGQFGGVIPELAGRAHQQHILPVVTEALRTSGIALHELDAVAYTQGPGLLGSLLVGSQFAKGLSMALNIPTIGIDHLQAHVAAHFIADRKPRFPFLCLLVSGGHTQIIHVEDHQDMQIIGSTIDDAAGEAFDKTAKMLGLPYPGGPLVDKYAEQGDPNAFRFPIARMEGYDYSFSGLKTSLLYFLQKHVAEDPDFAKNRLFDICASMRYTIVHTLILKLEKAASDLGISHIGIAGGVSANALLRRGIERLGREHNWQTYIPAFEYCTDNAAMIAMAAHYQFEKGHFSKLEDVPYAR